MCLCGQDDLDLSPGFTVYTLCDLGKLQKLSKCSLLTLAGSKAKNLGFKCPHHSLPHTKSIGKCPFFPPNISPDCPLPCIPTTTTLRH